jgi:hypothetical protein
MTVDAFKDLADAGHLAPALQALWTERAGDWDAAHGLAQGASSQDGDWVHAYLHRREGDPGNAAYWYHRAGQPVPAPELSLEAEWEQIAAVLLSRGG